MPDQVPSQVFARWNLWGIDRNEKANVMLMCDIHMTPDVLQV